jgi:hypothetical protein
MAEGTRAARPAGGGARLITRFHTQLVDFYQMTGIKSVLP